MSGIWSSIKGFFGLEKSELVRKLEQLQADAVAEYTRQIEQMVADGQKTISTKIDDIIIPALYKRAEVVGGMRQLTYECNDLVYHDNDKVRKRLELFLISELGKKGISVKKEMTNYYNRYVLCW